MKITALRSQGCLGEDTSEQLNLAGSFVVLTFKMSVYRGDRDLLTYCCTSENSSPLFLGVKINWSVSARIRKCFFLLQE